MSFSEVEFVTNFGEEIKCSAVLHAYTRITGAGQSHRDSLIDAGQSRWDSLRVRQHLFLFKSGSHSTASFERRCRSLVARSCLRMLRSHVRVLGKVIGDSALLPAAVRFLCFGAPA